MSHFADEFAHIPDLTWSETPAGVIYLATRRVDDNVWVRSAEVYGSNIHIISSIFESGRTPTPASRPFMTFWSLPVDDDRCISFFVSHVFEDDTMPFEERRRLEMFGQTNDRPYRERQWIPGDHDAQESQGRINVHALEHLGTQDRGLVLFRRVVKQGIQAVQRGEDPKGFYLADEDVAPSFANDRIVHMSEIDGDPDDPMVLRGFAEQVAESYLTDPPMRHLM